VLGFGNVLLSDDGAGVQLVELLRSELGPEAAEFVDGGTPQHPPDMLSPTDSQAVPKALWFAAYIALLLLNLWLFT
jgi:Ni,Fe-hydrogenase maturation factor